MSYDYDFVTAETAGKLVMSSSAYQYKAYKKQFHKEICEEAAKGQVATILVVNEDITSKVQGQLTSLLTSAGFDCSDWSFEQGDDGSCWYSIHVSWEHKVYYPED